MKIRISLFLLVFSVIQSIAVAELTKVDAPDNRLIEALGKTRFERATGSKLFLVDDTKKAPKTPVKVPGTVLHYDADGNKDSDNSYVVGDHNPIVDWEKMKKELYVHLEKEGIKDINDKWDEYRFLNLVSPSIAPPETHLLSEFTDNKLSKEKMAEISKQADAVMEQFKLKGSKMKNELIKLETLRQNIQPIGRTILKERISLHTEGRLPISDKNWMEIYAGYKAVTVPEMKKIEKETEEGDAGSYKDRIVKLPYFEGAVLKAILEDPEQIIAQKMLKLNREIRVHIMDGKLMHPNASFLRFYKLNEYLPEADREVIYKAVQEQFLDKLAEKIGPRFQKMYASADVVITGDGEIRIIDFNEGFDSGYYLERNDIFTANYQSYFFNGEKRTPLLEEYHQMDKTPIGEESANKIKKMFRKYRPFIFGLNKDEKKYIDEEVERAFWDRMIISYVKKLEGHATPEMFDRALQDFKTAGLRNPHVYLQFIAQVQDTVKNAASKAPLRLEPERLAYWQQYVGKRGPKLNIIATDGKIHGEQKPIVPEASVGCAATMKKVAG